MEKYKRKDGKNAKKYERTITYDKICIICGNHFKAKTWNAKVCKNIECQIENAKRVALNREERIKNREYSSKKFDREFKCEKCHKTFIKHTTNRKKFRFCDECTENIKRETYIYDKIQKYGTASNILGSGGNQWGSNNNQYKDGKYSVFENMPEIVGIHDYQKIYKEYNLDTKCYFCGKEETESCINDIHHKDGNHQNNSPENLMKLCRSCHKKLHYLYRYLGIEIINFKK